MPFNFKASSVKKEKFVRKSGGGLRGQTFLFKFRPFISEAGREELEAAGGTFAPELKHDFKLCDKYMDEMDLQNHSIAVLEGEEGSNQVALVVTPEGYKGSNTFVKKGENKKNPVFTHFYLMTLLAAAGIINIPEVNEENVPANLEDELLTGGEGENPNQYLDLVWQADVQDIVKGSEGEMVEVEKGTGMGIYEIVFKGTPEKSESVEGENDEIPQEAGSADADIDQAEEAPIEEEEAIIIDEN